MSVAPQFPDPLNSRVVSEVMLLLSDWTWQAGLERLRAAADRETDTARQGTLRLLAGWLAVERGLYDECEKQLGSVAQYPELAGWATLGRAFVALAKREFVVVHELLNRVDADTDGGDRILKGGIAHCRGTCWHHQGMPSQSLEELFRALELYGPHHFGTGRVLDTIGMMSASQNSFALALDFYQRALAVKESLKDKAGVAVSHGQLGRLHLDWGNLELAADHFQKDLDLCLAIKDLRGAAQMYNHLGQIALEDGRYRDALTYLNESVQRSVAGNWTVAEAFARKDRALAYLFLEELDKAEADLQMADAKMSFAEGKRHVDRVRGLWLRAKGDYAAAGELLRELANRFLDSGEPVEAARTLLEYVRSQRRQGVPDTLLVPDLKSALTWAEAAQRDPLIRQIEQELLEIQPAEHSRWLYRRVRGRDIREDTSHLRGGQGEEASVLFLDLCESTVYQHSEDAAVVLSTINHEIFSAMTTPLLRHRIIVNQILGDGFMALVRGPGHPLRSVQAGLDLFAVLEQFNRPRRLLALRPFAIRIGISTGYVCFGNVGTYQKVDFTAVGRTTNLAARLQKSSREGKPCVSEETYRRVRDHFVWDGPLTITPDGFPEQRVWLVVAATVMAATPTA